MGEKEFTKAISADGNDRLRVRIVAKKGVITDVVVQYEAKIKDRWHPVVRYDCSHGFFHRDMLTQRVRMKKRSFPSAISKTH